MSRSIYHYSVLGQGHCNTEPKRVYTLQNAVKVLKPKKKKQKQENNTHHIVVSSNNNAAKKTQQFFLKKKM